MSRGKCRVCCRFCISWTPGYASRSGLSSVYKYLVQRWNARSTVDKRTGLPTLNTTFLEMPIFFVGKTIATMPGHVMEYVPVALSQYYKAGLLKQRVPWDAGRNSTTSPCSSQSCSGSRFSDFEMGQQHGRLNAHRLMCFVLVASITLFSGCPSHPYC